MFEAARFEMTKIKREKIEQFPSEKKKASAKNVVPRRRQNLGIGYRFA